MTDPSKCSNCGAEFHCGVDDEGKCWCVEYPFVTPTESLSGCMCPACLGVYVKATMEGSVEDLRSKDQQNRS